MKRSRSRPALGRELLAEGAPRVTRGLVGACALVFAWHLVGCGSDIAKEQREFRSLEAAIGLIDSAGPDDRAARLEQLEALSVETERVAALKRLCVSSYQSFDRASRLLMAAKKETADVAREIEKAVEKKKTTGELTGEAAKRLKSMEARATATVRKVTKELDLAEGYVAACESKRKALRTVLTSE